MLNKNVSMISDSLPQKNCTATSDPINQQSNALQLCNMKHELAIMFSTSARLTFFQELWVIAVTCFLIFTRFARILLVCPCSVKSSFATSPAPQLELYPLLPVRALQFIIFQPFLVTRAIIVQKNSSASSIYLPAEGLSVLITCLSCSTYGFMVYPLAL